MDTMKSLTSHNKSVLNKITNFPRNKTSHYLSNWKRATSASLFRSFTYPSCLHHSNAAPMLTRVWLLSLSRAYFVAAISASGFLSLAYLAGWAVTSNAGCIFSAIETKLTSSPATPYFCREVCWIFPASVKRNVCTRGWGRDRGWSRQNETWRHLNNRIFSFHILIFSLSHTYILLSHTYIFTLAHIHSPCWGCPDPILISVRYQPKNEYWIISDCI